MYSRVHTESKRVGGRIWFCAVAGALLLSIAAPAQQDLPNAANTSAASRFAGQNNGNAPAGNVSKIAMRALLYPGATTRVLARFMPWFDGSKHSAAGYRSDDAAQVRRQVADMRSRGIAGAVVAWYGPEDTFKDKVTAMLFQEAERSGGAFQVALSYSGTLGDCARQHCDATARLVEELNYAAGKYFSSRAYVRVQGRPVVFFFDLEKFDINWGRVRAQVKGRPLFFFRNPSGFEHAESDGAYSWLEPKQATADDPAGLAYLRRFYQAAGRHPGKIAVGSVYKGFDDSLASWGQQRRIAQDCGNTWLSTWNVIAGSFDAQHQLPFVLVVTWNDYEEGTEIESGIEDCVSVQAQTSGQTLRWQISGDQAAVDHFSIFTATSGGELRRVTDVAPDSRQISLGATPVGRAVVQAVGKPSIMNHAAEAARQ